jgi:hypothetical protein
MIADSLIIQRSGNGTFNLLHLQKAIGQQAQITDTEPD